MFTGALVNLCAKMLPADWQVLRWGKAANETIISCHGSVEIHRTSTGYAAQISVKGHLDAVCGTALRRLARYTSGDNRSGIKLDAVRPVLQQQDIPGRWLISVGLPTVHNALSAPEPSTTRVKIIHLESATLAIVRVAGPPSYQSVARGEEAILAAIAGPKWVAIGAATLRLHAPATILGFEISYEVAVPVFEQQAAMSVQKNAWWRTGKHSSTSRPATTPSLPAHMVALDEYSDDALSLSTTHYK